MTPSGRTERTRERATLAPDVYPESEHDNAMKSFESKTEDRVRRALVRVAGRMRGRFTLDQFRDKWIEGAPFQKGGTDTSREFCMAALVWLQQGGFVDKAGMMRWRSTD